MSDNIDWDRVIFLIQEIVINKRKWTAPIFEGFVSHHPNIEFLIENLDSIELKGK